jgi:hypothetical protein
MYVTASTRNETFFSPEVVVASLAKDATRGDDRKGAKEERRQ